MATADNGGRVVIFRSGAACADYADSARKARARISNLESLYRDGLGNEPIAASLENKENPKEKKGNSSSNEGPLWTPCHQFQSHVAEFDYLKSLEIEGKVTQLKFLPSGRSRHLTMLTTNEKTVKLWKISRKSIYTSDSVKSIGNGLSETNLSMPRKHSIGGYQAHLQRQFNSGHAYHINSVTISSDGESFASADDLRINLWGFEDGSKCFNVVDCKPANMEDLSEVITCAAFHPWHAHTLAFSTSKGCIKVADLRQAALCNTFLTFSDPDVDNAQLTLAKPVAGPKFTDGEGSNPDSHSVFRELIGSISDLKFSMDGRFMATRDYLSIKIWDLNMTDRPVRTVAVHEHLNPLLPQLYESESIFDKFCLNFCPLGKQLITGSYNNRFTVRELATGRPALEGELPNYLDGRNFLGSLKQISEKEAKGYSLLSKDVDVRTDQRIAHCAWHPLGTTLAIAGVAGLHLYKL